MLRYRQSSDIDMGGMIRFIVSAKSNFIISVCGHLENMEDS